MNSNTDPLLARDALEQALVAAVEAYPAEETRFYQLLMTGKCPRGMLLRYARSTYLSASLFCASIAELVLKAPDKAARLILLENLMEEEGVYIRSNKGLVVRKQDSHPALALRFLQACGGDPADVESHRPGIHATGPGRQWLAEGRWLEAISFLLVGQEMKFATASEKLLDGLSRNGIARKDLAFFAVHIEADRRHGREALDLVLDRSLTTQTQQRAIAAARAGAQEWFRMHGGPVVNHRSTG